MRIRDIMTQPVYTVFADATAELAAELMATHDVGALPVLDHGQADFDRFRHGSMADHVIHHIGKPALLVRAGARVASSGTVAERRKAA